MEVFMHNLPLSVGEDDIKLFLASLLHNSNFDNVQTNFAVHIHRRKKPGARTQTGTFTLADVAIGTKFLHLYAGPHGIQFAGKLVYFKISNHIPRPDIIEMVSRTPWVDPVKEREQRQKDETLTASSLTISFIQFGWQCRDGVYSIEAESDKGATLRFDPNRRELHVVTYPDSFFRDIIAIRYSSIHSISRHQSTFDGRYVLFFELGMPPLFLRQSLEEESLADSEPIYSRMSTFPHLDNPHAIPFTGGALRLVLTSREDSEFYLTLSEKAGIQRLIHTQETIIERRDLFSAVRLDHVDRDLRRFHWKVAFQLASLLQNMVLDPSELLDLFPRIREIIRVKGPDYAAKLLRMFYNAADALWYNEDPNETISSCFSATERDFEKQGDTLSLIPDEGSYYESLHVFITPTSMFLYGPYPEQSNRVIRRYDNKLHENFLRVTFRDEGVMQYRFDREIDGPKFIKDRVGKFLKDELRIAGRIFKFLAYSQSALKEHSVW
jgi:hypothetical protein